MANSELNQANRLKFAKIGKDVIIRPTAKIVHPELISLGDRVIIDDFVLLIAGKSTTIGSFVHIAPYVLISGGGDLLIEDFVGISSGVKLYTGNDDYLGGSLTGPTVPEPYRNPIRSFVTLRKHALIGANSVILPGVEGIEIGEGAAIGANSFVTQNVEPWTIYVGSPARPLRPRPKEKILELEEKLRRKLYKDGIYTPESG